MKKRQETKHTKADFKKLCDVLAQVHSSTDMQNFLIDLCTPAEIESLSDRLKVAYLLEQELSYRDIAEKTGVSVTTVTRVARALRHGTGGYGKVM